MSKKIYLMLWILQHNMAKFGGKITLQPTKKTGNYMIYEKLGNGKGKKVVFKVNNVMFPFGREEYNNNTVLNIQLNNKSNYIQNMLFDLVKIKNIFEKIKENDMLATQYNIKDCSFFDFLKPTEQPDTFILRTYLRYGASITHKGHVGNLDHTFDMRGKYGEITFELGSMWVNQSIKQYGVNIYTSVVVVY